MRQNEFDAFTGNVVENLRQRRLQIIRQRFHHSTCNKICKPRVLIQHIEEIIPFSSDFLVRGMDAVFAFHGLFLHFGDELFAAHSGVLVQEMGPGGFAFGAEGLRKETGEDAYVDETGCETEGGERVVYLQSDYPILVRSVTRFGNRRERT